MKYSFICYPKCTACQSAKKWLDQNRINYVERHISLDNPTAAELREWLMISGRSADHFFNKNGSAYREKNLKEKLPLLSDDQKIALLSTDGMLMKHPIIVGSGVVLVDFIEEEWQSLKK